MTLSVTNRSDLVDFPLKVSHAVYQFRAFVQRHKSPIIGRFFGEIVASRRYGFTHAPRKHSHPREEPAPAKAWGGEPVAKSSIWIPASAGKTCDYPFSSSRLAACGVQAGFTDLDGVGKWD
jgi:hypothetical protein